MSKIKIGYLQHGLVFGGAPISLYLLQKSLDKNLFAKYLFVTSWSSPEIKEMFSKENEGIFKVRLTPIHNNQCSKTPVHQFIKYKTQSVNDLIRFIRELHINILHINTSVFPHLLEKIKNKTQIKILTHIRELINVDAQDEIDRYFINNIYNYSDGIVAITDNEARPFQGHPNLHVLPNPFDFSQVTAEAGSFRRDHGIPNNCIIVGMLGQFHKFKGHMVFLEALEEVIKAGTPEVPVLFVILGAGPEAPLWKRAAKKILGKADYFQQVSDFIKGHDLAPYIQILPYTLKVFDALKAMDLVVRPSLSGDPWGRDVIEAMALGKPVVATGTSEFFVENGVTGYLVPPGQPWPLAQKILTLIYDPEQRREFGRRAVAKIRRLCDLEQYGNKMTEIYQSLLQN